jgi:hypothetical protein
VTPRCAPVVSEEPADGLRRPACERRQSLEPGIESGGGDLEPAERCEPFAHSRGPPTAPGTSSVPLSGCLASFPAIIRVLGLDIPSMWVRLPTTTRSAPSRTCAPADVTGTTGDLCAIGQPLGDGLGHLLGAPEHRFVDDDWGLANFAPWGRAERPFLATFGSSSDGARRLMTVTACMGATYRASSPRSPRAHSNERPL